MTMIIELSITVLKIVGQSIARYFRRDWLTFTFVLLLCAVTLSCLTKASWLQDVTCHSSANTWNGKILLTMFVNDRVFVYPIHTKI